MQTASGFRRFLVDSPISRDAPAAGSTQPPPGGYGTFHQQYWLNGGPLAHACGPDNVQCCAAPEQPQLPSTLVPAPLAA